MSEQKNDTINEFFKVQQINDYQRAFEELSNRMKSRKTKRYGTNSIIKQINTSPANDNNKGLNQYNPIDTKRCSIDETINNDNNKIKDCIHQKKVSKKNCFCVLF